jgi:hypothetical protein
LIRAFAVLAIVTSVVGGPLSAEEPVSGAKRIGVLRADTVFDSWIESFRKTLDALGYV